MQVYGVKWLLPVIAGLVIQGSAAYADQLGEVTLSQLRIFAFEAKVATVPLTIDGVEYRGKIKGLAIISPRVIDIEPQPFSQLDALKAHVQETYCTSQYVPTGEIEFNAGRHINTRLSSGRLSAAAVIRIEITYDKILQSGQKTSGLATSVMCPRG